MYFFANGRPPSAPLYFRRMQKSRKTKLFHTITVYTKHSLAVVHKQMYSRIYFTLCDL